MNLNPKSKGPKPEFDDEDSVGNARPDTHQAAVDDEDDQDYEDDMGGQDQAEDDRPALELKVPLSKKLLQKLKATSEEEGISMQELSVELITEGVVLRVWEILERNQNMRGSSQPQSNAHNNQMRPQNNQRNNNYGRNNNHRGGGKGGRHQNNMNIMQDKAAFLEYVRNQERKRR